MKATIKVTHKGVGHYEITAKAGRAVIERKTALTAETAEMKADIIEQKLLDAGYQVTVTICK